MRDPAGFFPSLAVTDKDRSVGGAAATVCERSRGLQGTCRRFPGWRPQHTAPLGTARVTRCVPWTSRSRGPRVHRAGWGHMRRFDCAGGRHPPTPRCSRVSRTPPPSLPLCFFSGKGIFFKRWHGSGMKPVASAAYPRCRGAPETGEEEKERKGCKTHKVRKNPPATPPSHRRTRRC